MSCKHTLPEGVTTLNAPQVKELLNSSSNDIIVIDVRTPEEAAKGMLPNALLIDVENENFIEEVNKLDKNKKYLLYCKSGMRSGEAASLMKDLGFKSLIISTEGYEKLK